MKTNSKIVIYIISIILLSSCQKIEFKHQPFELCYWNYYCGNDYIYFNKKENYFYLSKGKQTYYNWDYNKRNKILSGYSNNKYFEFYCRYEKTEVAELNNGLYYVAHQIKITIIIDNVEYIFKG